jgi:hypothetical protein
MITPNCQLLGYCFSCRTLPDSGKKPHEQTYKDIRLWNIAEWTMLISSAIDLLPEEAWTSSTASASLQVIQIHPFIARTVIEQV